jgi:hypothetical protein
MPLKRDRRSFWSKIKKYTHLRAIAHAKRAKKLQLLRPEIVPLEYTGKWVAWTSDGRRIVAAGDSAKAAKIAAEMAGVRDALYEWIPKQEELRSMSRREVTAEP